MGILSGSKIGETAFRLLIITLLVAALCACSGLRADLQQPQCVLFVGNSLTYFGNLPAVYSTLSAQNDRIVSSDMIVKPGATLSERVADGSVAKALEQHEYSVLVLQERGGDLICGLGPETCVESRLAIHTLAELGRRHGATVVLLGTYQTKRSASESLVKAASAAALAAGIAYVEVSETLLRLRRQSADSELVWFAEDGMHPGKHLTLLNAILLYQQIHQSLPAVSGFTVTAPIYGNQSGLTESLRPADAPPPNSATPNSTSYGHDAMRWMIDNVRLQTASDD